MDTTSKRLTEYSIDADTSVAVVGFKQLTELERSILPPDYETIDPFTGTCVDIEPFSKAELVTLTREVIEE